VSGITFRFPLKIVTVNNSERPSLKLELRETGQMYHFASSPTGVVPLGIGEEGPSPRGPAVCQEEKKGPYIQKHSPGLREANINSF
jgi:hypothetical protein